MMPIENLIQLCFTHISAGIILVYCFVFFFFSNRTEIQKLGRWGAIWHTLHYELPRWSLFIIPAGGFIAFLSFGVHLLILSSHPSNLNAAFMPIENMRQIWLFHALTGNILAYVWAYLSGKRTAREIKGWLLVIVASGCFIAFITLICQLMMLLFTR